MSFNYFNNNSVVGKKTVLGITNLNSNPTNGSVTYVSNTTNGVVTFSSNNTRATSIATIFGNSADDIDYSITIIYNVSGLVTLNWILRGDTEACCDVGNIFLNNIFLGSVRGVGDQTSGTTTMLQGTNTLHIEYSKDGSVSGGADYVQANWTFT
jgi:hypothetical protein